MRCAWRFEVRPCLRALTLPLGAPEPGRGPPLLRARRASRVSSGFEP
jgi:hypothetical protein